MFARTTRRVVVLLGLCLGLLYCMLPSQPAPALAAAGACVSTRVVSFPATPPKGVRKLLTDIACATSSVRNLLPHTPVAVLVVDAATLRGILAQVMQQDAATRPLDGTTLALQLLGGLSPKADLAKIRQTIFDPDTIAQYDWRTKVLYVRQSSTYSALDRAVIAHGYAYALEDQAVNLAAFLTDNGDAILHNSDAQLARAALVEGAALTTMQAYAQATFTKQELFQFSKQVQGGTGASNSDLAHDEVGFPVAYGPTFVRAIMQAAAQGKSKAAVSVAANASIDQALRNPPDSTAEILNPTLYLRHAPTVSITSPSVSLGSTWGAVDSDVLGAYGIGDLWDGGSQKAAATQASATWQGDRWTVYRKAHDAVLIWHARFANVADAQSCVHALIGYTATRFHATLPIAGQVIWATAGYALVARQNGSDVWAGLASSKDLLPELQRALNGVS